MAPIRVLSDTCRVGKARLGFWGAGVAVLLVGCATTVSGTAGPAPAQLSSLSSSAGARITSGSTPSSSTPSSSTPSSSTPTTGSSTAYSTTATRGTEDDRSVPNLPLPPTSTEQPGGKPVDPAEFQRKLAAATAATKTMQGTLKLGMSAGVGAEGDFRMDLASKNVDIEMSMTVSGQSLAMGMRVVGGKLYISGSKVLSALGADGYDWALASADSANPTLRQLSMVGSAMSSLAGSGAYASGTITAVGLVGSESVNGHPADRYQIQSAGRLADLWLDPGFRPLKTRVDMVGLGTMTMTFDTYNAKVSIPAPDPETVFTG